MQNRLRVHRCQNVPWAEELAEEFFQQRTPKEIAELQSDLEKWEKELADWQQVALSSCNLDECRKAFRARLHQMIIWHQKQSKARPA